MPDFREFIAQMVMPACNRIAAVEKAERLVSALHRHGQLARMQFETEPLLAQAKLTS